MIGIYKIVNPKGKVYIGQSLNIEKRWKEYLSLNCKGQVKLYNSLCKYGPENHTFEILEECIENKLSEREHYWQVYYEVLGISGLNLEIVNPHAPTRILSEETRKKMSLAQQGKKHKQETLDKIRKTREDRGIGPHTKEARRKISEALRARERKPETYEKIAEKNRGRKNTEESKEKMRQAQLGKKLSPEHKAKISATNKGKLTNPDSCKRVAQLTNQGLLVKVWPSISAVARHLQISNPTVTSKLDTGKLYRGFLWKKL